MEPNEKPKFNWTRLLITIAIVLVTAGVVCGTTWYLMDKSAKEIKIANDKTVTSLEKNISDFKTNLSSMQNKLDESEKKSTEASKTIDYYSSLKTYCTINNPEMVVGGVKTIQTADGVWGDCGIHVNGEGGGAIAFYKYVTDTWQKMYVGNGLAPKSVCDTYQVPREFWFCEQ